MVLIKLITFIQFLVIVSGESPELRSTSETTVTSSPQREEVQITSIGFGDREDGDEMIIWDKRMFNSSQALTSVFNFKYDNFRFTFANLTTTDVS